jgi:polyhydroxyalkanoate synthesis regulator phasin
VELKPFRDFVPSCGETSLYRAMNIKNLRRKLDYLEKRVQILEEEYKY